jgi:hypothetical protein
MKDLNYLLVAILMPLVVACHNPERSDATVGTESYSGSFPGDTAVSDDELAEEMPLYRERIMARLEELDQEIETITHNKRGEKNTRKLRDYDHQISEREKTKRKFREHLSALEQQTAAGWERFRLELEALLTNDKIYDKPIIKNESD